MNQKLHAAARRAVSEIGRVVGSRTLIAVRFDEYDNGWWSTTRIFARGHEREIIGGGVSLWRGEMRPSPTGRSVLVQ